MNEQEPREVQSDPVVLEGEDPGGAQPAPPLDPYTPEPRARPGEQKAWAVMRLAWIPLLVVVGIIIWAAVR